MLEQVFDDHLRGLREKSGRDSFDESYYEKHRKRFLHTCNFIPRAKIGQCALEVGATEFFQVLLRSHFNYSEVVGTDFHPDIEKKLYKRDFSIGSTRVSNLSISLDLESDLFPYEAEKFDFILCSEVIEHLEKDPMFMLCEFNRIMSLGARLLLTTPNSCSARNFWKVAKGYRPHFFMQYHRARGLYRHNIEYDVRTLLMMAEAAGFGVVASDTLDVFEETVPEAIQLLQRNGLPTENRGDDIFLLVEKQGGVRKRWPYEIYV